ncbi:MAG TPA: PqqD family protein [Blastocatellia bacterium]|nr:PqqD family protein [Blastocatellia bacterium]
MLKNPLSRKTNLVVRELANEVLLYDLSIHKAYSLNETSALVYWLCDGTKSVAEIREAMTSELKTPVSEDIVWLALKDLKKQNLLENGEDFSAQVAGLSRRELLKKARLSSIVMLPVIVSIVVPQAAMAATCVPISRNCTPGGVACCPHSICAPPGICACSCVTPGDCLTQTNCPSTVNCNGVGVCAP